MEHKKLRWEFRLSQTVLGRYLGALGKSQRMSMRMAIKFYFDEKTECMRWKTPK
jgi:hypothetical protein